MSFATDLTRDSKIVKTEWDENVFGDLDSPFLVLMNSLGKLQDNTGGRYYRNVGDPYADFETTLQRCWHENQDWTVKLLFYAYDIRQGAGKRDQFRLFIKFLEANDQRVLYRNLEFIPEYGRWDMLVETFLYSTDWYIKEKILNIVNEQLIADTIAMNSDQPVSLAAKWLPSHNVKRSQHAIFGGERPFKDFVKAFCKHNDITQKQYRQAIVKLRAHIGVLEAKMSRGDWDAIDLETVPGVAMHKYRKAFENRLGERWNTYLTAAEKGEATMHAKTMNPVDIVTSALAFGQGQNFANAAWNNRRKDTNGLTYLPFLDTSGSMTVDNALYIGLYVALHFAEMNQGDFHEVVGSFSDRPSFMNVDGLSFSDKCKKLRGGPWGMTTNLHLMFDMYLNKAKRANPDELPGGIILLSDMEFYFGGGGSYDRVDARYVTDGFGRVDACYVTDGSYIDTVIDKVEAKFARAGIPMPHLVVWNMRQNNLFLVDNRDGYSVVSGDSTAAINFITHGDSPLDMVKKIVESERYAPVGVE